MTMIDDDFFLFRQIDREALLSYTSMTLRMQWK